MSAGAVLDPSLLDLSSAHAFNTTSRPRAATEDEIKLTVPDNDITVYSTIPKYLQSQGMLRYQQQKKRLLTRQIDTPNLDLYEKRIRGEKLTLRVRSECLDTHLRPQDFSTTDICLKVGGGRTGGGALSRGEYQAAHPAEYDYVTFDPLRIKYPRDEHPELHEILDRLEPLRKIMSEHFRIDCDRDRLLIELPHAELVRAAPQEDWEGKRVIGETALDHPRCFVDYKGLVVPYVFKDYLEVENEIVDKPCLYDLNPESQLHFSSPGLTDVQRDAAMSVTNRHLHAAAPGKLAQSFFSKADNGFEGYKDLLAQQPFGPSRDLRLESPRPRLYAGRARHIA